jgi:hypothetical protein
LESCWQIRDFKEFIAVDAGLSTTYLASFHFLAERSSRLLCTDVSSD